MKKIVVIALAVFWGLLLVGCQFGPTTIEPTEIPIDYVATIEALLDENDSINLTNEELSIEVENLESNNSDLQDEISSLQDELTDNETVIFNLNTELENEKSAKESEEQKVEDLYDVFLATTGDQMGEFVLCTDAYNEQFKYIDKLSMRTELEEYVAGYTGVNPSSVSSTHQMIWSNTDDGLIKVFAGGYMYPFIVRFENPNFGAKNSVYSLTSGCYVDFPALENEIRDAYRD